MKLIPWKFNNYIVEGYRDSLIYNTWFWLCGIKKAWLPGKQRNLCEK